MRPGRLAVQTRSAWTGSAKFADWQFPQ